MMRTYLRVAAVLAAAALTGCGSSPKSSFYTLSSSAPSQQVPATESFGIAISAVAVPDVIDRPQFVTRTGANELVINEFARWGEPLKVEIPRVMAADLSRELSGAFVTIYPQSSMHDADIIPYWARQRRWKLCGRCAGPTGPPSPAARSRAKRRPGPATMRSWRRIAARSRL